MRTKKITYFMFALITATLLLSVGVSFIYARYASTKKETQTVTAPDFYFESNMLTEEGKEHSFSASVDSVTFEIYNFADSLRISTLDVNYTVTVTCEGNTVYNKTGTIQKNVKTAEKITVSDLEAGKTYEVEVVGENGFKKTIRAIFKIHDETGFFKLVDSSDPYCVILKVWTADSSGTVTVTPPTELIPDNTWDGMDAIKTGDSFSFELSEYSSKSFRFFKPSGYSGSYEFSAKLNGVEATLENVE